MSDRVAALQRHFEQVFLKYVQGLPIVNPNLEVETVGFREHDSNEIGVLITPWFMNLVVLPGGDEWDDRPQGDAMSLALPSSTLEFTLSRDEEIGTYLTAVLFRTVVDFPNQALARDIATEVLERLFDVEAASEATSSNAETFSRRTLFTLIRGS